MTRENAPPRHVLILGLDTFAKKNVTQIRSLEAAGYCFTVLTNDQRGDSEAIFDAEDFAKSRIIILRGGIASKLRAVWRALAGNTFNHVELYAAGRMSIFYLLMIRLTQQKLIVVERGDIDIIDLYGPLVRLSLRLAYRIADAVIYKETYMAERLARYTGSPQFFVPNCVEEQLVIPHTDREDRSLDFLWVNRTIPQRRAGWVIEAAQEPSLAGKSFTFLGIEKRENLPEHIALLQRQAESMSSGQVTLLSFGDPTPYYQDARYFCLPATIVFGNNSLLEAMSWGVVPVVTAAPGVELIVQDGENGIVVPFDQSAYRSALIRAAALSADDWRRMSVNAIATVREKYSVRAWTQRMDAAYRQVGTNSLGVARG